MDQKPGHMSYLEGPTWCKCEHDEDYHGKDSTTGNILKVTDFRPGEMGVRTKVTMVRSYFENGIGEKDQTVRCTRRGVS